MFRPSASIMYSSATSRMRTQPLPKCCANNGRISSAIAPATKRANLFFIMWVLRGSGAVGHAFAEQDRQAQREHEEQHVEGEDVLVVGAQHATGDVADVARAERLDDA